MCVSRGVGTYNAGKDIFGTCNEGIATCHCGRAVEDDADYDTSDVDGSYSADEELLRCDIADDGAGGVLAE